MKEQKEKGVVYFPNALLQDPRISLEAIGLFGIIHSWPEEQKYDISSLAARVHMSRGTVRKYLKELKEAGYLAQEAEEHAKEAEA